MMTAYFDYAATTYIRPEVLDAMRPYMGKDFGNPSGVYRSARKAKNAVENARSEIASLFGAKPQEIYFTSGGTESNNWAIFGVMQNNNGGFLTSSAEHKSVLNAAKHLKSLGRDVRLLSVDNRGVTDISGIEYAVGGHTKLISVMTANNETGIINQVNKIGAFAHENGILFHTDAVAAAPHIILNIDNIDLMSVSAHKLYGPKGIGLLYIREGTNVSPFLFGGEQESRMRAGTENVAGIVGFAKAFQITYKELEANEKIYAELRDYMKMLLLREIPGVCFNGDYQENLPSIINISLPNADSRSALIALDIAGIECSSGSACMAGGFNNSHVLEAMGIDLERINNALRFSFGLNTNKSQIDYAVSILKDVCNRSAKRL